MSLAHEVASVSHCADFVELRPGPARPTCFTPLAIGSNNIFERKQKQLACPAHVLLDGALLGTLVIPAASLIMRHASGLLQVLVVANPANTNALILKENAPKIPSENISCLTRLDHNRALGQVAEKAGETLSFKHLCLALRLPCTSNRCVATRIIAQDMKAVPSC